MSVRGRNRFFFALAAILLFAGATLVWLHRPPAVSEREHATRILAEFLKNAVHPKAVLVIGNPFLDLPNHSAQIADFEQAGIAGLKKGFGGEIPVKVTHPKLKAEVVADPTSVQIDPQSPTPLSFMVESAAFDDALKGNRECDLAVSLIGLPVNLAAFEAWTHPGAPRFGLLLPDWRMIGGSDGIQKAFASGKLVAALVQRPNSANQRDPNQRYQIVSSNNVAEEIRRMPDIFGLRRD